MKRIVIVRDGKTTNLKNNYPAINGDAGSDVPGVRTPSLPDGEYDARGFEHVLQTDDQPPNKVWQMSYNEQHDMAYATTRNTLYYYQANVTPEAKISTYLDFGDKQNFKAVTVVTPKKLTEKEYRATDNKQAWLTIYNHFEFDEIQDFLNRKGYELIVHTAVHENLAHRKSEPGTGSTVHVGNFNTERTYTLAVKVGTPLPTRFTPETLKEFSYNAVFQKEIKKNILK